MIKISKEHGEFIENNYDRLARGITDPSKYKIILDLNGAVSNENDIILFIHILHIYTNSFDEYYSPNNYLSKSSIGNYYRGVIADLATMVKKHLSTKRSKVIDKYYNYGLNVYEYELANGDFVKCENSTQVPVEIPLDEFPLEFLKVHNEELYRRITRKTTLENIIT